MALSLLCLQNANVLVCVRFGYEQVTSFLGTQHVMCSFGVTNFKTLHAMGRTLWRIYGFIKRALSKSIWVL